MKIKIIKKFWGIGLIVMLLASLFVVAAPASAGDPLTWNMEIPPGATNNILVADLDIRDMAVAGDGSTVYAVGATNFAMQETATVTVSVLFVDAGDGLAENFAVTYTDQDGVINNAGTLVIPSASAVGATVAVGLAGADTGMIDITAVAPTGVNDCTAGAFTIASDTTAVNLGLFTVTAAAGVGTFTDGSAIAAAPDTSKAYKSTNAGASWVEITTGTLGCAVTDFVAVAPDDPLTVAIVDGTTAPGASLVIAYVSTNGGATFDTLGAVGDLAGGASAVLKDVAISPQVAGGTRYIAIPGSSAAGAPVASLFYFNLGAASPDWKDAVTFATDQAGGTYGQRRRDHVLVGRLLA